MNTMTTAFNLYRSTPRGIRTYALDCFYAKKVPFIRSSPGMGKSEIMQSIADEMGLKLIDHRLSTSPPEDLSGLPRFKGDKAEFVPFNDLFPTDDMEVPAGYNGWLVFLDEFNSAKKETQAASYKLILDRMTGQRRLHNNVLIALAGNLDTDRAITNPISTALRSRVIHLEMELNFEEWLYDVALKRNWDSRIIAFLSQYPSLLMDFNPNTSQESTFCCPRTWSFVNDLINNDLNPMPDLESKITLLAGTITSGVAANFVQFTKVFKQLVTIQQIEANPDGCPIPQDQSLRWATITHMMEKINEKNFEKLSVYADRFPMDFRILFYRSVLVRNPKLRQHNAFITAMTHLGRYLAG